VVHPVGWQSFALIYRKVKGVLADAAQRKNEQEQYPGKAFHCGIQIYPSAFRNRERVSKTVFRVIESGFTNPEMSYTNLLKGDEYIAAIIVF